MKNRHKQKKQKETAVNGTRDLVIANRVSGKVHGGLSRIRLSLTFRIALHYCVQLFRSFIPVALILSVLMCLFISYPVSRELRRMIPAGTEENGLTIENGYLSAVRTEVLPEKDFFPWIGQQFPAFFSNVFSREEVRFYYSPDGSEGWLVCLNIHDLWIFWMMMMGGVIFCDIFRMIYFFRHDQRLNKRVLSPIRDIASMAETLSESNLSNRINIAGTKNELKDLATVINRMLDRIERSYNSQKQFVSDASHELRTPISVIRGYTDMLRRWGKDDPEVLDEGIAAISQETEGMKDLVESLLFLARHDKKTLMMEISAFDPSELVNEVIREETMVHTEYRFETNGMESMQIKADRNMMKQVLRILCDNAVKYSQPGTAVTLACTKEKDGMCCLSVKDQGQGIPQEDLPKIFDRFYRSDKARKSETGGHGLGLSIARIIVIAHNGKIRVRSKPGAGTIFSVLLPEDVQ
ncbi:MAG: HAMP domain-containing histidine kinase [Clostridiales bacterium]|nr:HAMP domain-containing histidine kinase [Clostridiales bacterium]